MNCQICDRKHGMYDLWRDICSSCQSMLGDMKPGVAQMFRNLLERLAELKADVAKLKESQK